MPMPWFRMHWEWCSDAKVQTLPFEWQRHFMMILCWHAGGILSTLSDEVIADSFRMTTDELTRMKGVFRARGFIGENGWAPRNWDKRQRASDDSSSRVRAHREREKAKRNGGVTVTSPLQACSRPPVQESTVTVTSPLRNGTVTDLLLSSPSPHTPNSLEMDDGKEEERTETVTSQLRNGYTDQPVTHSPAYPDPDTAFNIIHQGNHTHGDDVARETWRRIWATWKDERLCLGWYEHQRWYSIETWQEAFAQVRKKFGVDQTISIGLVERFAADIDAAGKQEAKPPAPSGNGRPKTKREEYQEAASAKLAKLNAMLGDDDEEQT